MRNALLLLQERFERGTEDHMAELSRRVSQLEEHYHNDRDKYAIQMQVQTCSIS